MNPPSPIVGSAGDRFVGQQFAALGIVLAVVIIVFFWRRWAAALRVGVPFGQAFAYTFAWKKPAPVEGQPSPTSRGLLLGTDNRVSTSKTTAALWTLVVLYFIATQALIAGYAPSNYFNNLVQTISLLYLVFLGGPFAAAVLAKVTVSTQTATGQLQKSTADSPQLADVFSDDDGNTDLVDVQYLVFNLLVAIIVLLQFIHAPGYGAPPVPDFLAILTGGSAATYVANKALVSGNPPSLDRIAPTNCRPGGQFLAFGANFIAPGDTEGPKAFLGGSTPLAPDTKLPQPDQAAFRVPADAPYGPTGVTLRTPGGLEVTFATQLTVVQDEIVISQARPTSLAPGGALEVYGNGFYNAADVNADGTPTSTGAEPAIVKLVDRPDSRETICGPVAGAPNSDSYLKVQVPADILGGDNSSRWFDLKLERGTVSVNNSENIAIQILGS